MAEKRSMTPGKGMKMPKHSIGSMRKGMTPMPLGAFKKSKANSGQHGMMPLGKLKHDMAGEMRDGDTCYMDYPNCKD
jgi:hypothetical protein